jgi:hypothetical protein
MLVSARTGEGMEEFRTWLAQLRARALSGATDLHSPSVPGEAEGISNGQEAAAAKATA